jgi:hypothetical protein
MSQSGTIRGATTIDSLLAMPARQASTATIDQPVRARRSAARMLAYTVRSSSAPIIDSVRCVT